MLGLWGRYVCEDAGRFVSPLPRVCIWESNSAVVVHARVRRHMYTQVQLEIGRSA